MVGRTYLQGSSGDSHREWACVHSRGKRVWDELKESLFIEDGFIPLPSWPLYPSDEGLNFVYHQYEIASYAEGMPSFTVPYADIEPFLTPAARELLGL